MRTISETINRVRFLRITKQRLKREAAVAQERAVGQVLEKGRDCRCFFENSGFAIPCCSQQTPRTRTAGGEFEFEIPNQLSWQLRSMCHISLPASREQMVSRPSSLLLLIVSD
jgi:hypothetical protein